MSYHAEQTLLSMRPGLRPGGACSCGWHSHAKTFAEHVAEYGGITLDLNGCARCNGDGHPGITFQPLTHPVEIGGHMLTHWAPCPTNGEPILMEIRPQPVPEED